MSAALSSSSHEHPTPSVEATLSYAQPTPSVEEAAFAAVSKPRPDLASRSPRVPQPSTCAQSQDLPPIRGEIALIWAQARDVSGRPAIGFEGKMPWHLPEDFAHFKKLTSGHPIIMGERTWLSLPQGALPNRTNIVLSHDLDTDITPGAHVVTSVAEALQLARESTGGESVWVIGGSSVYEQMIPLADSLVVTEIDLVVSADTYAPEIPSSFQLDPSDETWLTSKNGTAYRFRNYTHKPV